MFSLLKILRLRFRGVQVYALVGKSGSGKSFRARLVMSKYSIDLLIDDGLLIQNERIISGQSAKRAGDFLSAVRVAIFEDRSHREEVARALQGMKFKRILIIGTSNRMVRRIASALELPDPIRYIAIEHIASPQEIQTAIQHRSDHGSHVVPVPAIEVQRNYPRMMVDSLRVILRRGAGLFHKQKVYEKSLVRPEFGERGSIQISEQALGQMIGHCAAEFMPGVRIQRMHIRSGIGGYALNVHISTPLDRPPASKLAEFQRATIEHIESYTGVFIKELNIIIDNINYNEKKSV